MVVQPVRQQPVPTRTSSRRTPGAGRAPRAATRATPGPDPGAVGSRRRPDPHPGQPLTRTPTPTGTPVRSRLPPRRPPSRRGPRGRTPASTPSPPRRYGNGAAWHRRTATRPPRTVTPLRSYGAPPPGVRQQPLRGPRATFRSTAPSSPYGVVPVSHPQSTTALIFGILGIVFGFSCGIGGLLGSRRHHPGPQGPQRDRRPARSLHRTLAGRRGHRDRRDRPGDSVPVIVAIIAVIVSGVAFRGLLDQPASRNGRHDRPAPHREECPA